MECGSTAPAEGSGDLDATGPHGRHGLVAGAVVAVVVDGEPGGATGFLADATGGETGNGAFFGGEPVADDRGIVHARHNRSFQAPYSPPSGDGGRRRSRCGGARRSPWRNTARPALNGPEGAPAVARLRSARSRRRTCRGRG